MFGPTSSLLQAVLQSQWSLYVSTVGFLRQTSRSHDLSYINPISNTNLRHLIRLAIPGTLFGQLWNYKTKTTQRDSLRCKHQCCELSQFLWGKQKNEKNECELPICEWGLCPATKLVKSRLLSWPRIRGSWVAHGWVIHSMSKVESHPMWPADFWFASLPNHGHQEHCRLQTIYMARIRIGYFGKTKIVSHVASC